MSGSAPDFDTVARIYRFAEYLALGRLLERTRKHFLPLLDDRRQALALGDGDGRFLAAFLRRNAHLRATAVDSSAAMLELLRERCAFAGARLSIRHASLLDISPPFATDIVITHFVLDCFEQSEIEGLARRTAATTRAGTLWLVSDFALPHARIMRPLASLYIRSLYLAFGALTGLEVRTLPDPQKALNDAGFTRLHRHERLGGFLYSELWQNNAGPAVDIHLRMSDSTHPPFDAQPDPEPAVPSLSEPDPGVYHHETGPLKTNDPSESKQA